MMIATSLAFDQIDGRYAWVLMDSSSTSTMMKLLSQPGRADPRRQQPAASWVLLPASWLQLTTTGLDEESTVL